MKTKVVQYRRRQVMPFSAEGTEDTARTVPRSLPSKVVRTHDLADPPGQRLAERCLEDQGGALPTHGATAGKQVTALGQVHL